MENLILTGTAAINGFGNGLNNTLLGNGAANVLNGLAGADRMEGGAGDDTYVVDDAGDEVIEAAGGGIDAVQSSITYVLPSEVETLVLTGTAAINGTGNALANAMIGNGAANVLDGGAGADRMAGGAGDDTYIVDDAGDVVIEAAGGGLDTVRSSVSHVLAAQVENLVLTGTAAINGFGNGLNNTITGNARANGLSGGAGNDTLDGGLGSDLLRGGDGADVFLFRTALGSSNVDRLVDFVAAEDRIHLSNEVFTALPVGSLAPSAFTIGTAATTSAHRVIYNSANGFLFYDADGAGGQAAVRFAILPVGLGLTAGDFWVI